MVELTTEIELRASPRRVWAALTGFRTYPSWHPWLRISGEGGSGKTILYSLDPSMKGRKITLDAEIREWLQPERLQWVLGFPCVFTIQEQFLLHQTATGTRMQHGIECRGIFAVLLGRFMTRKINALLSISDRALAAHLAKRRSASPVQRSGAGGKQRKKRGRGARGAGH